MDPLPPCPPLVSSGEKELERVKPFRVEFDSPGGHMLIPLGTKPDF